VGRNSWLLLLRFGRGNFLWGFGFSRGCVFYKPSCGSLFYEGRPHSLADFGLAEDALSRAAIAGFRPERLPDFRVDLVLGDRQRFLLCYRLQNEAPLERALRVRTELSI
jgi:hypothetical protein